MKISLKAARVNVEMTQTDMAKAIGVDISTICSWESGKTEPSASQLRKISEITHIPMDYLFLPCESK